MKSRWLGLGLASVLAAPLAALAPEVRIKRAIQPLTERWRTLPIETREATLLGISVRTPQIEALGLDGRQVLETLLAYPFQMIRLGAYWARMEPAPRTFEPAVLDAQVEAAERAGKQIVLCVGALKTFGYPEFFVPAHHLPAALPEHTLIRPDAYAGLLEAATAFSTRVVERYRGLPSVVAWQIEHEAVDPLGMEHSWRLAAAFVEREVQAVRRADPTRPILMNGYLPVSLPVRVAQWWQTRDQGDSLAVAQRLADIVGLDYYPRHALLGLPFGLTVYLDGKQAVRRRGVFEWARSGNRRVMISEGQAEPWEAVTRPPDPSGAGMYSCRPEDVIGNYNTGLRWAREAGAPLLAYLFWGAEYWVLRAQRGDPSYLRAFARIVEESASVEPGLR